MTVVIDTTTIQTVVTAGQMIVIENNTASIVSVGMQGAQGIAGAAGATGATGSTGASGQGVPIGGTTDQVLAKASNADFDGIWRTLVTGVSSVFGRAGAVVANIADYAAFYIKLNGTTTTTASIPFAEGLSTGNAKTIVLGSAALATARGSITNDNDGVTITGLGNSAGSTGANLIIKAGTGPVDDSNGGMLRLRGGAEGPLSDISGRPGFVTTDTAVVSFSASNSITGTATSGHTPGDFYVGSNTYLAGFATCAQGIGTNGAVVAGEGYCLLADGTGVDLAIGIGRHGTGAGRNLTVHGGWARVSTTNSAGGNIILAPGRATGNGAGSVIIQATGGGSSGTADRAPTTIATWGRTVCVYNVAYTLDTALGLTIGKNSSDLVGFWGANPIVRPTTSVAAATFIANTSGIANNTATFDGYTIGQVVRALRNAGLLT